MSVRDFDSSEDCSLALQSPSENGSDKALSEKTNIRQDQL